MNDDYSAGDIDFSGMSDDELLEIVNARLGGYRQEVVDGAKNELKNREDGTAQAASNHQVTMDEAPPPVMMGEADDGGLQGVRR